MEGIAFEGIGIRISTTVEILDWFRAPDFIDQLYGTFHAYYFR